MKEGVGMFPWEVSGDTGQKKERGGKRRVVGEGEMEVRR